MSEKQFKKNQNPVGRPSLYKQEHCDLLKEHFSEGYSYQSFAGSLGVEEQTLYNWEAAHPEFLEAKNKYWNLRLVKTEEMLIKLAEGKSEGNVTAAIFLAKNAFPKLYRDRKEIELTQAKDMTLDELVKEAEELLKTVKK